MIPEGWVLVPVVPSDRMLTEFSGVWALWLPKNRRELELKAYADMLAVVPTPPSSAGSEIDALRAKLDQQRRLLARVKKDKDYELNRAFKKLKNVFDRLRVAQARIAELENAICEH